MGTISTTQSSSFDVLIVGGGVIGLSLARELRKAGFGNIAVIDRRTLGREASYAAAGILSPQAESDSDDTFSGSVTNRFNFSRISPASFETKPVSMSNLYKAERYTPRLMRLPKQVFAFDTTGNAMPGWM